MTKKRTVAYFSMEIGLEPGMPTYSGGLGVLAGDTVRSAADLKVPLVAVSLLHSAGYFYQRLDRSGWQTGTHTRIGRAMPLPCMTSWNNPSFPRSIESETDSST